SGPKTKNEGIIVRDAAAHEEVQYKNPTEIVLSPVEITGKVERRVISQAAKGTESTATEPSAARSTPQLVTFQTPLNPTTGNEEFWSKVFREQELDFTEPASPGAWKNYMPMLVLTGLFILVFFLMLRRLGGAGSPMAFGRSRGKMYAQEDIGITFEDVAG